MGGCMLCVLGTCSSTPYSDHSAASLDFYPWDAYNLFALFVAKCGATITTHFTLFYFSLLVNRNTTKEIKFRQLLNKYLTHPCCMQQSTLTVLFYLCYVIASYWQTLTVRSSMYGDTMAVLQFSPQKMTKVKSCKYFLLKYSLIINRSVQNAD